MPIYEYQCDCGVRFERFLSVRSAKESTSSSAPCPECQEPAKRLMPKTVSGVFVKDVTGPVPQNTGIHSLDTHIDRVIGQSSKQGWSVHEQRQEDKAEVVRNNPGVDPHALAQNPDGTWRPLTEKERGIQVRAQTINSMAMNRMGGRRRARPAPSKGDPR